MHCSSDEWMHTWRDGNSAGKAEVAICPPHRKHAPPHANTLVNITTTLEVIASQYQSPVE